LLPDDRPGQHLAVTYVPVPPDLVMVHTEDITERKQLEEALRARHELYETLVETSMDALFVEDSGGRLLDCNTRACEMYGYSKQELLGLAMADLLAEELRESAQDLLEREHAMGGLHTKTLNVTKGGRVFPVEVNTCTVVIGGQDRIVVFVRDITECVQAEEALNHYIGRLEILRQIDAAIADGRSMEEIARMASRSIRRLISCPRASVALLGRQDADVTLLAVSAEPETSPGPSMPLALFSAYGTRQLARGAVWHVEDIRVLGDQLASAQALWEAGLCALQEFPLMVQGELAGILTVWHADPSSPGAMEIEGLRDVADRLTVAIRQSQLREQARRQTDEMEHRVRARTRDLRALYEVATAASESLDLRLILDRSLQAVLEALSCQQGTIHLFGGETDALRLAAQRGLAPDQAARLGELAAERAPMQWVIECNGPLMISVLATDPRLSWIAGVGDAIAYLGLPIHARGKLLGVMSVFVGDGTELSTGDVALLASVADRLGLAIENAQLRRQTERIATLEERERLARELHDVVAQSLYSLCLFAEAAKERATMGQLDEMKALLNDLSSAALHTLREMRLLLYQLRPADLAKEGLVGALRHRLNTVEHRSGIEARITGDVDVSLSSTVEEALYRIAQEALSNSLRHGQAGQVVLRLAVGDDNVTLEIRDDGQGFDLATARAQGGMGLRNMRERAAEMGGRLTIESSQGRGTLVRACVPLAAGGRATSDQYDSI